MGTEAGRVASHDALCRAARFASLCAFMSSLPLYSPNIVSLNGTDPDPRIGEFVEPMLYVTFAVTFLVLVLFVAKGGFPRLPRIAGIAATFFYVVGCGAFVLALGFFPSWGGPVLTISAFLAAVGVVSVSCQWARSLHDLDLPGAILLWAAVSTVTVVCNLVLGQCGRPLREVLFGLFVLMGAAWPARTLIAPPPDIALPGPSGSPAGVRGFLSVVGAPLLGMAISSFATAVQPVFLGDGTFTAYHFGSIGAAALLVVLWQFRSRRPLYSFIYQVFVPIVAFVAVVLSSLPYSAVARDTVLIGVNVFYSLVSLIALASAVAIANAREFDHAFVFAAILFAFTGMSVAGLALGSLVPFDNALYYMMAATMTAAYGGWMLLHGCIKSWKMLSGMDEVGESVATDAMAVGDTPMPEGAEPAETFEERLGRIADEAGLSPREREIMGYVGRGHSSVYVAKTLLISESTVYTHVRNIYRKLDISCREDLIQLLNV